jgi:hypothetical protein
MAAQAAAATTPLTAEMVRQQQLVVPTHKQVQVELAQAQVELVEAVEAAEAATSQRQSPHPYWASQIPSLISMKAY